MHTNKIRILKVSFELPIYRSEIPQFRGAIIEKVGREHILFHNHINHDPKQFRYRYPLIQYKCYGKEGHAGLLCLNKGVEDIHQLFGQESWDIRFRDETHSLQVRDPVPDTIRTPV